MKTRDVLGAPIQSGVSQPGCVMGPAAFRTAGLCQVLADLGWTVTDLGDATPLEEPSLEHVNTAVRNLDAMAGWTRSLSGRGA